MSALLEQAEAAILAIIDEHVAKATTEAQRKLEYAQQEFEVLKVQLERKITVALYDAKVSRQAMDDEKEAHAWTQVVLSTTRLAYDGVAKERDQACAELAGVAAQRDAHLSRSVELAARVTELEARLAAVTPAVDEVDGFRAGDLVRNLLSAPCIAWGRVTRVGRHVEVTYPTNREAIAYKPDELCRKPVEVGDTVRVIGGVHAGCVGRVDVVIGGEARVIVDSSASLGEARWVMLPRLVAIAPTVKP